MAAKSAYVSSQSVCEAAQASKAAGPTLSGTSPVQKRRYAF